MGKEFLENRKGVHLVRAGIGDEYTICGDAFDINEAEGDYPDGELRYTSSKTVTCPDCIEQIEHCRNVKTRQR